MNDKPCVKCGGTERGKPPKGRTIGACKACRKAYGNKYNAKYHAENRDKLLTYGAKYRADNPEKTKARSAKYYAENRDRRLAYSAKYRAENPEKARASVAKYRAENPEKEKAHAAKYRAENRDKRKFSNAKWHAENREKVRVRHIKYYYENRDKILAYGVKYRVENPEKHRVNESNRRARIAGAEGSHTAAEWQTIIDRYGCICLKCGSTENITKDHIVALVNGGSNWPDNLQPLCGFCNSSKGARNSTDYRPAPMVSA